MVAAKLANMPVGNPSFNQANLPDSVPVATNAQAASMLNVSERSIKTAKQVQEKSAPELVAAVDAGKVSVSAAAVMGKSLDIACLSEFRTFPIKAGGFHQWWI